MKTNRLIKWVLIVSAVALLSFFVVAVILFFFPPNARHRTATSVEGYGQFIKEMSPLDCILFPEESLLSKDNCVFYDKYSFDGSNTPQYLTYAQCTFSEEVFNKELARITGLASEYSEVYFAKPVYILYYNFVGSSEYALIEESSHTIHYVCYSSSRFYDRLPTEDRIYLEYQNIEVDFRDLDYYYDLYFR